MQEKNNHILKKIIAELPQHAPDASLWDKIEGVFDSGKHQEGEELEKLVEQLPGYEPAFNLWERIEKKLDHESPAETGRENLINAIRELPQHEPSTNTWIEIEKGITKNKTKVFFIQRAFYPVRIAASIILLVGSYWFYSRYNSATNEHIITAYSEEIIQSADASMEFSGDVEGKNDDELMELVQAHCNSIPQTCENPYFNGLLSQYKELKNSQEELQSKADGTNEEPFLQKSLVKIEKEKTKVVKKLVQCLVS